MECRGLIQLITGTKAKWENQTGNIKTGDEFKMILVTRVLGGMWHFGFADFTIKQPFSFTQDKSNCCYVDVERSVSK